MAHAQPEPPRRIFTLTFWVDAIDRAISAASNQVITLPILAMANQISDVPWHALISAFALSAFLDLMRSLAAAPFGNPGTATMLRATKAGATPGLVARFAGTKPPSSGPTPAATPPGGGPAA